MKYKVIGWTYAFDEEVEYAPDTVAAENAIIDDIRENGYLFTGMDHQGCQNCTPVLNDGKKRIFSDREFGCLMAEAHGEGSYVDYAFGFYDELDGGNTPPDSKHFDKNNFVLEDISETFIFDVTKEQFDLAKSNKELKIDDSPSLRYIEAGDRVLICFDGQSECYDITNVEKGKDLPAEIVSKAYRGDKEARELLNRAKIVILLTLEQ